MNIHKGSLKVIFKRKFALNSPNLCITLKKKKGKGKRRKIELIRSRLGSFIIKRGSFVRFMCKVSFCILFIWVCLIIYITLGLVLRQFRFSLRVFKLSSRFFLRDYVKAVLDIFPMDLTRRICETIKGS